MTLEYIRQSLFFFRRNFGVIARIQLPFIILLNLVGWLIQSTLDPETQAVRNAGALLMLLNLTLLPIYWGATILFLQSVVDNRPLGALTAIRSSLKYWRRLLLTYLMMAVAVTLGLLLFIVPGIVAGVRLAFADYVCVLENRKAGESLRQSWGDTREYFWLLLNGMLIIFGGLFLMEMLFTLIDRNVVSLAPLNPVLGILLDLLGTLVTIYGFRVYCLMKEEAVGAAPRSE
ncbi:MAG: hypothetical protein HWE39_00010 [Oceanospirillaceae bacterium]|nr:hypothetical protein [Oceanospirillaceae bacterium]